MGYLNEAAPNSVYISVLCSVFQCWSILPIEWVRTGFWSPNDVRHKNVILFSKSAVQKTSILLSCCCSIFKIKWIWPLLLNGKCLFWVRKSRPDRVFGWIFEISDPKNLQAVTCSNLRSRVSFTCLKRPNLDLEVQIRITSNTYLIEFSKSAAQTSVSRSQLS